jgi:hypothetical protein
MQQKEVDDLGATPPSPFAPLFVLRQDNDGVADCDDADECLNGRAGLRFTPTTKYYVV